jgi:hypothetical protein
MLLLNFKILLEIMNFLYFFFYTQSLLLHYLNLTKNYGNELDIFSK